MGNTPTGVKNECMKLTYECPRTRSRTAFRSTRYDFCASALIRECSPHGGVAIMFHNIVAKKLKYYTTNLERITEPIFANRYAVTNINLEPKHVKI